MDEEVKARAAQVDEVVERLKSERVRLERELRQEYRKARRYVRAHPEEGVALAFLGGVCIGLLLSKLAD